MFAVLDEAGDERFYRDARKRRGCGISGGRRAEEGGGLGAKPLGADARELRAEIFPGHAEQVGAERAGFRCGPGPAKGGDGIIRYVETRGEKLELAPGRVVAVFGEFG